MVRLIAFYIALLGGLSTMLHEDFGWLAFGIYMVGMPLGALAVWTFDGRPLAALGAGPYPGMARHVTLGAAGAALAVAAIFVMQRLAGWASLGAASISLAGLAIGLVAQQAVVAVIEELTFRGVIQRLLAVRLGAARGLGVAAVLFGLFHLPNLLAQDVPTGLIPIALLALSVMGVVFGWAYERSGRRLALPAALHFGWNVAAYGLEDAANLTLDGPAWLVGRPAWFPESGVMSLIGLAMVGGLVWRLTPRAAPPEGAS